MLGLKVMQTLAKNPNENIKRYWKEKIKNIKSIIKAQKYSIEIPEPLQFMNSDDEMMEEIHKKIAKDKEKEALRSIIPTAITQPRITTSSTVGNLLTLSAEQQKAEQQPIKDQKKKLNQSTITRPTTAQPWLSKATTISVHKHQWSQKGNKIGRRQSSIQVDKSLDNLKPGNDLLVSGISK